MTALRIHTAGRDRTRWTAPVGTAAHAFKHGPILPLGTVLPIERVRRPLLARLFGGKRRG